MTDEQRPDRHTQQQQTEILGAAPVRTGRVGRLDLGRRRCRAVGAGGQPGGRLHVRQRLRVVHQPERRLVGGRLRGVVPRDRRRLGVAAESRRMQVVLGVHQPRRGGPARVVGPLPGAGVMGTRHNSQGKCCCAAARELARRAFAPVGAACAGSAWRAPPHDP